MSSQSQELDAEYQLLQVAGQARFYGTHSFGKFYWSGQAVGGQHTILETKMKGRGRKTMLASEFHTHLS